MTAEILGQGLSARHSEVGVKQPESLGCRGREAGVSIEPAFSALKIARQANSVNAPSHKMLWCSRAVNTICCVLVAKNPFASRVQCVDNLCAKDKSFHAFSHLASAGANRVFVGRLCLRMFEKSPQKKSAPATVNVAGRAAAFFSSWTRRGWRRRRRFSRRWRRESA